MPTTFENYKAIQARQKILNEFVQNLNTIKWQDSLLVMAKMDTATLRKHIISKVVSPKPVESKSKKRKNKRIEIKAVNTSIASDETTLEVSSWYFGNPSAVALGQSEFTRIWGALPLEDNWRRSSRTTTAAGAQIDDTPTKVTTVSPDQPEAVVKNPVAEAYDRISKELPLTEKQVAEAHQKIEDAYFRLGDIYYFDLKEQPNAVTSYKTLLTRYPSSHHRPEVLYKLYLIFKTSDEQQAEQYASELKSKFPESPFAKTLVNPNYLKESGQVVERQKKLYQQSYESFQQGNYSTASQLIEEALALEKTSFHANLELLKILIIGKTENISQYQFSLDKFVKDYPESDVTPYAQKLLQTSRDYQLRKEKEKGIQYIKSFEEQHYFVFVSFSENKIEETVSQTLESFNTTYFNDLNLKVSNLILNETYTLTLVSDLPRVSSALEYYKTFTEKRSTFTGLKDFKFSSFVITKDNFDIFYRTKGLDEYLQFFEKNYHPENP